MTKVDVLRSPWSDLHIITPTLSLVVGSLSIAGASAVEIDIDIHI